MKFTKHILPILALLATAVSCNNTEDNQTPSGSFEVEASASYTNTDQTRTTLNANGSLSWTNSDVLGIYAENIQTNTPFTRVPTGGFIGTFTRKGQADKTATFYAYYPHSGNNNGYVVSGVLSNNQDGKFNGQNDFMVANPISTTYSESSAIKNLKFNFDSDSHLFSILHLTLADNNLGALANEAIKSVTISSEGNVLSGEFTMDVRDPNGTLAFTKTNDHINITFASGAPTLNNPIDLWIVMRPTDAGKPINLTIDIATTQGKARFQTTKAITLQRSKIKELPTLYVCDNWERNKNVNDAFLDDVLLDFLLGLADNNSDGQLTTDELESVKSVNINGMDIASLAGLELLEELTSLSCVGISASEIKLSNPKLHTLDISNNKLKTIDLSGAKSLSVVTANKLEATRLDLSGCTGVSKLTLEGVNIKFLTLKGLNSLGDFILNGTVQNLSMAGCETITKLDVVNYGLYTLDVSNCTNLVDLNCYDNANLTSLIVKGCTNLSSIMTRSCAFTSLDLSGLSSLHTIYCQRNNLTSINLAGCTSLGNFYAHTNKWVELDFSECTNIGSINIKDTPTIEKITLPAGKNPSIINYENCGTPTISYK
ncbi:MAG: fimbrillin family protein [Rikenellaceae bacterium]|nr:fimbrillin family protein [Rikenellaceae bacterium]